MSAQASPPVPAGWYPDPQNPAQGRYWDGSAWTDHLHQPGQPAPKLRAPEGTEPNTVWIWLMALLPVVSAIPVAFIPWQGYIDSMFETATDPYAAWDAQFALLTSPAYLATIGLAVLLYGATALLGWLDYRELTARGMPKPFHWALTLVPSYGQLIYVIGRSVVVKTRTGRGLGPLWVTIAIVALTIVLSFVLMLAIMAMMADTLRNFG